MTARRGAVPALSIGLGAAGLAAALWADVALPRPAAVPLLVVPAIGTLLAISAHLILRFRYRDEIVALDLFESVLVGAIVLLPAPVVLSLVVAVLVVVELLHHRTETRKIAFNVAQWCAAAGAGAVAYNALAGRVSPAVAIVGAMTAIAAVNIAAITAVVRLTSGDATAVIARRIVPSIALSWATNTMFGFVFLALYRWHPTAMALFAFMLLVLHGGYRGYATALADRTRIAALHRATGTLVGDVDPLDAMPAFLEEVRACFDAADAWIVLSGADGPFVYATGQPQRPEDHALAAALLRVTTIERIAHPHAIAATLAAAGRREALTAPIEVDGRFLGVLATFDRSGAEGFEHGEVAVLGSLAREAAHAMRRSRLTRQIIEERLALRAIVDGTSDGICTIDAAGLIEMWNPAMERITGHPAFDMVGAASFHRLAPRDAAGEQVMPELRAASDAPEEIEIVTADGARRWLLCSFARVPDRDEIIIVARDHTAAHELEELKDDFISTVSHELRTPLTPIRGWAAMLSQQGDRLSDAEKTKAAQSILRQAEGLERLIVNLLDMARLQRGVIDIRDTTVEVPSVVEQAVADVAAANPARRIRVERAGGICRAAGDDLWVQRIVVNLLANALKYSPESEPVDVVVSEEPGSVSVSVIDRGRGIAHRDQARIFERFQRLGDYMTRDATGAGVGLHISRQLAEAMGATLSVQSAPGAGSVFTLRLPAAAGLSAVG